MQHSGHLALGWPTHIGFPGAFLVLSLTVLYPANPSLPSKLGWLVIHPWGSDLWLRLHPHLLPSLFLLNMPSKSNYLFHRLAILCSTSLPLSLLPSAWDVPSPSAFRRSSPPLWWFDKSLTLWAFSLPSCDHRLYIYGIFSRSVFFSAVWFFITCRTNLRRKTADTQWVTTAKKEYKRNEINQ